MDTKWEILWDGGHGWMDVLFCLLADVSGSLGFGMGVLIFFVSSWLGWDPKFLVVLVVFSPVFFFWIDLDVDALFTAAASAMNVTTKPLAFWMSVVVL